MQCPQCDTEIDASVSFCPECGYDIESLRQELGTADDPGVGSDSGEDASSEFFEVGSDGPDATEDWTDSAAGADGTAQDPFDDWEEGDSDAMGDARDSGSSTTDRDAAARSPDRTSDRGRGRRDRQSGDGRQADRSGQDAGRGTGREERREQSSGRPDEQRQSTGNDQRRADRNGRSDANQGGRQRSGPDSGRDPGRADQRSTQPRDGTRRQPDERGGEQRGRASDAGERRGRQDPPARDDRAAQSSTTPAGERGQGRTHEQGQAGAREQGQGRPREQGQAGGRDQAPTRSSDAGTRQAGGGRASTTSADSGEQSASGAASSDASDGGVTSDVELGGRIWPGFKTGVSAYVLSFIVTTVLAVPLGINALMSGQYNLKQLLGIGAGAITGSWMKVAGWFFYNSQFVPTTFSIEGSSQMAGESAARATSINFVTAGGSGVLLLAAIAPLFLFRAGRKIAASVDADDGLDSFVAGALVAAGYLPLVLAGVFVFQTSLGGGVTGVASASATMGPDMMRSVLVMGVAYPVVFGGVGGFLR